MLLWVQRREGGPRLNGRADERVPNVDAGRTDIVWGMVNDGPNCHCRTPPMYSKSNCLLLRGSEANDVLDVHRVASFAWAFAWAIRGCSE